MRLLRLSGALEDQAGHDMADDVAMEGAVRGRPERDLGGKRAGNIFLGHGLQTGPAMLLERVARIDLKPGNTNIPMPSPYSCRNARDWRPGRQGGVKAVDRERGV